MVFHDWKFDKRVIRRNLRRKLMTQEEHKAYLQALPDSSQGAAPLWDGDRSEEVGEASGVRRRRTSEAMKIRETDDD